MCVAVCVRGRVCVAVRVVHEPRVYRKGLTTSARRNTFVSSGGVD